MINALFLIIIILTLLLVNEFLKKRFSLKPDFTRKIAHITSSLILVVSPYFIMKIPLILACLFLSIVLVLQRKINLFSSINEVARKSYGEFFFPMGVILVTLFYLPDKLYAYQYGVLVLGFSDTASAIIGDRFGKNKITVLGGKKSFEGSLAFFVSTLILTYIFLPVISINLVIISLVLSILEFFLGFGSDNLLIPITAALLLSGVL